MRAQTYQDIEAVLINEPVKDILETALFALATKHRIIRYQDTDPETESQCVFAIHKLELLLKAYDRKY